MTVVLPEFGARVRERRLEENMTQGDLALRVGISRTYLGQIEQGIALNLTFRLAQQLSAELEIDVPKPESVPVEIPPSLQAYAVRARVPRQVVEMLAAIQYRGERPETEDQWRILHQVIRATVERTDRGEG